MGLHQPWWAALLPRAGRTGCPGRTGVPAAAGLSDARGTLGEVTGYRERPPAADLAGRVACVWSDRHEAPPRTKPIVPDACIDLIWSSHDGSIHVAGPDTEPFPVTLRPGEEFAGVRFRPGAAAAVLGLPAGAIRDTRVPLPELWGREADRYAEALGQNAADRAHTLERLVRRRVLDAGRPDPAATAVVRRLATDRKARAVRTLAGELGYSERHLLRRCRDAFGYGPKTLQRILRFQQARRLIAAGSPLADVAASAGYADQAHLTREVQRLGGRPPSGLVDAEPVTAARTPAASRAAGS